MSIADVCVIMPTWNRANYLGCAIDSIGRQTADVRIELIVADDASNDNTAEVIRERTTRWAKRMTIQYLPLPKGGVCVARNKAIASSTAPLVTFLDSDDVWEDTKLADQLPLLSDRVGLVHSDFRYIDPVGHYTDNGGQRPDNPARGKCLTAMLAEDTVVFSTVLVRRKWIDLAAASESHGLPFDLHWVNGEDYDLLLRIARLTDFGYVNRPLAQYRVHANQTGMSDLARVFRYHCQVQMAFIDRWGSQLGLDSTVGRDAAQAFLLGRCESLYWQRKLELVRKLCGLATELGFTDSRFLSFKRRASRPRWLLSAKDTWDRIWTPART